MHYTLALKSITHTLKCPLLVERYSQVALLKLPHWVFPFIIFSFSDTLLWRPLGTELCQLWTLLCV